MGGFVRVFSSRSGSSGANVSNQIMFSSPAILYSYDDYSYSVMPNKRGFSFTETKPHADSDHEGVALTIAGLDPVKEYTVSFTLRASRAEDCTYSGGKSNAVGFTQSLDNIKDWDKKLFGITESSNNIIYKSMRFDNGTLTNEDVGSELVNYIPITSVSTTPVDYSILIKRGNNGTAFLCFQLAYPNTNGNKGPMVYYFENFSITNTEAPVSDGESMSLYCYSEDSAHINGYTSISNLNIEAGEGNPHYQVIKVNARGKCANGKATIQMKYGGSSQTTTTITLGQISEEEYFDVTYTLGITISSALNLTVVGTYNPGIYASGSYTPTSGIYSDDLIDISCTASGSDSVLFDNTYKNPSGNMIGYNIASEETARQIATDVGIILKDYVSSSSSATYTTYENTAIVEQRARSMDYNIHPVTPSYINTSVTDSNII